MKFDKLITCTVLYPFKSLIVPFYPTTSFIFISGTGVTTYSLHPGVIYTELIRHGVKQNMMFYIFDTLQLGYLIKTPEEGAQTTLYCAIEESLASVTGKYYRYLNEKMGKMQSLMKY